MSASRRRLTAVAAVAGMTALTGLSATMAQARPSSTSPTLVITIREAGNAFKVAPTRTFRPGMVTVHFTAARGEHTVQLLQLHPRYTLAQLRKDISAGLEKGSNTHAIERLDTRVTWLGGAMSSGGHTATFSSDLPRGTVYAVDQNSRAQARFAVRGRPASRPGVPGSVVVRAVGGNSWSAPPVLPREGWVKLRNSTDQPQFFVALHVKQSTTAAQVRTYAKSGSSKTPRWALSAENDSGVFSPLSVTALRLHLPAGKYLLACFWPDETNGATQFSLGMWKLVHLR